MVMSDFLITDTLLDDLATLYYVILQPDWKESWKAKLWTIIQIEPEDEPTLDKIVTKLQQRFAGGLEPLPFHIELMIDGLEDGGLVKRIASLGHLENLLKEYPFFSGAFLTFRDTALDDTFLALEQSNIKCVIPFGF